MTDLSRVLPDFPAGQHAHMIQVLERHRVTTTDLLTLDVADIGKQTKLPLLDLKRLCDAVVHALHKDLGVAAVGPGQRHDATATADPETDPSGKAPLRKSLAGLRNDSPSLVSTLDDGLDRALGGGIPTGYITEITGESGAGKTQFLLSLLLAAQLPAPHGLGRSALYISTEAAMSTVRLSQILKNHPRLASLVTSTVNQKNLLDGILSTATPDLESQEHILQFQVPVMIERHNVGLLILDSVAANYRAEFERGGSSRANRGSDMAARSAELVRLGGLLRNLAQKHNLAVVVANQVADRFSTPHVAPPLPPSSSSRAWMPQSSSYSNAAAPLAGASQDGSPLIARRKGAVLPTRSQAATGAGGTNGLEATEPPSSMPGSGSHLPMRSSMPMGPPGHPGSQQPTLPALALDHQQRWFTGWGDDPFSDYGLKTPSLGLVWSTQIACRIALLKKPVYGVHKYGRLQGDGADDDYDDDSGLPTLRNWRRWMKVVFAPHVPPTGPGLDDAVEFEVTMGGLRTARAKDLEQ